MKNKIRSFKGWESFWMNIRMNFQMHLHLFFISLFVFVGSTSFFTVLWYREGWSTIFKYIFSTLFHFQLPDMQWVLEAVKIMLWKTVWIIPLTLPVSALVYMLLLTAMRRRAEKIMAKQWIRGARLATPKQLKREMKGTTPGLSFSRVAPIRMPLDAEVRHTFIVGQPGVGKTVLISSLIEQLIERGSKGIIYDFKGDYLLKYYDPSRDIIFNPLEQRGVGWSVLSNEISTYMDVDAVAHSLIPPAYKDDPFWNNAARDVFAGILHYAYQAGAKTNKDIWELIASPILDLASFLKNTKGGERGWAYIQDASGELAANVIAVMMQYTKSFEYLSRADGDFSVRKWLENERPGFIYVTNYSDIKDTLKPALSLLIDLLGRRLLSMADSHDRRIWFIVDEFTTLERLSTLVQLLTLSRSKGGGVILGTQDIGQIDKLYTKELRQSIVNACNSCCIFSVADPDTAKFLSDKIGETEYTEPEETISMGPEDMRDGLSMRRNKKTEKLFLPSEIADLRTLEAVIKFPNFPYVKAAIDTIENLRKNTRVDREERFLMKPEFNLDNLVQEQTEIMRAASAVKNGVKEAPENKQAEATKEVEREQKDTGKDNADAKAEEGRR